MSPRWPLIVPLLILMPLMSGAEESPPKYILQSLRGKVLWTAEALKSRFGIEVDAAHRSVSLVTDDGQIFPLINDARGRGFLKDDRLLNRPMELEVRKYPGSPFLQVIRVYTIKDGKRYTLDYWCDICAIIMYELQDCECCQGPIRLREEPAP
jgi:hypothetical protein